MLIYDGLKKHFPARISEWFNAVILASWGAYLLLNPDLFDNPATGVIFADMARMVWFDANPESVWGLCAFAAGLTRLSALFINGAWGRTPLLRLITAAISAFIWTQVAIGLLHVPNTGLAVYPWLVVIDLVAAYRAGSDVAVAELARRNQLRGRARDRSSRSRSLAAA